MKIPRFRIILKWDFFFFFGWARPEFASLQGGPAQYHLAKLSQENYFYFLYCKMFWDMVSLLKLIKEK